MSFTDADQTVLRYCTTCPKMCRFACPVAHVEARETVTPWGLVSLLNLASRGAVPFDDETAAALARCTGCLRCQTGCMHDNHVPHVLFEGRAQARELGLEAPWTPPPEGDAPSAGPLSGEALGFAAEAAVGFWAACSSRHDDALELRRVAALFRVLGAEVQLISAPEACCGYPQLAAGQPGLHRDRAAVLQTAFEPFDRVITDCDGLLAMTAAGEGAESWSRAWGRAARRVEHWTDWLEGQFSTGRLAWPDRRADEVALAYHDSCRLCRGAEVGDAPRALLARALGGAPIELDDHAEEALCCGAGAGYPEVNPEGAAELARTLHVDAARAGADTLVSASPRCARHLAASGGASDVEARSLPEVLCQILGVSL